MILMCYNSLHLSFHLNFRKLRLINVQLREQARSGVIYAPGLTYAPPMPAIQPTNSTNNNNYNTVNNMNNNISTAIDTSTAETATMTSNNNKTEVKDGGNVLSQRGLSCEIEDAARVSLKKGKNLLAKKDAATAMVYFNKGKIR